MSSCRGASWWSSLVHALLPNPGTATSRCAGSSANKRSSRCCTPPWDAAAVRHARARPPGVTPHLGPRRPAAPLQRRADQDPSRQRRRCQPAVRGSPASHCLRRPRGRLTLGQPRCARAERQPERDVRHAKAGRGTAVPLASDIAPVRLVARGGEAAARRTLLTSLGELGCQQRHGRPRPVADAWSARRALMTPGSSSDRGRRRGCPTRRVQRAG